MSRHSLVRVGMLAILVVAAFPICAQNLAEDSHGSGATKLSLGAAVTAIDMENSDMSSSLTMQLSVGYFFADQWELSVNAQGFTSLDSESDYGSLAFLAALKYYFVNNSICVPYIGPQVGGIYLSTGGWGGDGGSSDDFIFTYGGILGLEFMVKESISFFVEYNLLVYDIDLGFGVDSETVLEHKALFGLSYYF